MSKIFYALSSDIIEKSGNNLGLIDILQKSKFNVYTELAQIRGEKIDIAYVPNDDKLIGQLAEVSVSKISIFANGSDRIVVPKNYVKISSDLMISMRGHFNVVLNSKNYVTEVEFIIQGEDNPYTDVIRNVYLLYGNVITSTWARYDLESVRKQISMSNIPNPGNIYIHVHTVLEGLKKCVIRKYIIRVNAYEYFSLMNQFIEYMKNNPEKLICNNLGFRKLNHLKFGISESILAGKYELIQGMFQMALNMLHNKLTEIRRKIRLEFTSGQILSMAYLHNKIDFINVKDDGYIRNIMIAFFHIFPVDEMGIIRVPLGRNVLMNPINKELYDSVCELKSINDI